MASDLSTVDLIFAEFGADRKTSGDAALPADRLEPALSSFRKYIPDLNPILYTDVLTKRAGVSVRVVKPPFDQRHHRWGNRANDYYKLFGLRESSAELAIATDADMLVVSEDVLALGPLAAKFGLLAPPNGRMLVRRDMRAEADGSKVHDESRAMGFAYNGTPYVLGKRSPEMLGLIDAYLNEMRVRPCRGPVAMWRAVWRTGVFPYLLPFQYCLCSRHIDLEHPCIVHVGHDAIKQKFMGG